MNKLQDMLKEEEAEGNVELLLPACSAATDNVV